jgi:hypothetical protein
MSYEYGIDSRAYLERASNLLLSNEPANFFYAAFELRCGIEARLREYLWVWNHIDESKKNGWQIAKLGKSIENEFRHGDKIIRWDVIDEESGISRLCLYHTPVTKRLRKNGEKLGNYLHALQRHNSSAMGDNWLGEFISLLKQTHGDLKLANTGTLLGPPLKNGGTGNMDLNLEIVPGRDPQHDVDAYTQRPVRIDLSHIDKLPSPIEPTAVLWPFPKSFIVR